MSQPVKTWKILELIKATEEHFRKKGIQSARLNTELLLCGTLNTKRINLYLDFEKPLTESELNSFREKVKRRLAGEPLQYILGEAEFYGLRFKVSPYVLVPRQETELLVDKTLEVLNSGQYTNPKILDIGTGSGCISVAIAATSACCIDAIDISPEAIQTAEYNSILNGTQDKISFIQKDFLNDIYNFNGYDIVLSNPPYIAENEMESLEKQVREFEPAGALTDGSDGLNFYRKIIDAAMNTNDSLKIFLEIGDGKKEQVELLLKEKNITYKFYKDLLNIERVLYLEK